MTDELPNKPSELITVALDDLVLAEQHPKYLIGMDIWHDPQDDTPDPVCKVCLAGAAMAFTLKMPRTAEVMHPLDEFDEDTASKLEALNDIRHGDVDGASQTHPMFSVEGIRDRTIPQYRDDRVGFFKQLRRLANDYRTHGH